jgi:hypothetical protein
MNINYECRKWQGLVEMIVNLVGNGYVFYNITSIPKHKLNNDFLKRLDSKMISKYRIDLESKDTFYKRKKRGLANFRYLRWQNVVVVLRTFGDVVDENAQPTKELTAKQIERYMVTDVDQFKDIRQTPLVLPISDATILNIQFLPTSKAKKTTLAKEGKKNKSEAATVKLSKRDFQELKGELEELIIKRHVSGVYEIFKRLNNLPAWRGIIIQKSELRKFVLEKSKTHNCKVDQQKLQIVSIRKKETNIFGVEQGH